MYCKLKKQGISKMMMMYYLDISFSCWENSLNMAKKCIGSTELTLGPWEAPLYSQKNFDDPSSEGLTYECFKILLQAISVKSVWQSTKMFQTLTNADSFAYTVQRAAIKQSNGYNTQVKTCTQQRHSKHLLLCHHLQIKWSTIKKSIH